MKYLLLVVLCLSLVYSQNPYCITKDGKSVEKAYLYSNESQAFNLGRYFAGYNLAFSATGTDSSFSLVQHLQQKDFQPIDVTDQYTLLDFDIYSDGNLAWNNRAASLGYSLADNSYYIRYGSINDKMNVVINTSVKIDTTGSNICFDVVTATDRNIALDCQNIETKTDYIYLYDQFQSTTTAYPFNNSIATNKRKTLPYRITGNRTYLLLAWIGSEMADQAQRYNSFVNIYYLDSTNVPSLAAVVDAKSLGLADLSISDIAVDAVENIYLADERGTVVQFRFDGTNILVGKKKNFNTPLYKISVHVTESLSHLVQVVGDHYIYEINFDTDSAAYNYLLPNGAGGNIVDFQSNYDLLIAQTNQEYLVYRRHQTSLNNMLASFATNGSKFALSPRTPNLILLGLDNSISFITSEGFLLINNSQANNQTIVVTATSQSADKTNSTACTAQFIVGTVTDDLKIWPKRDFNTTVSSENPAYEVFNLDDYFVGSRMTYQNDTDKGVTTNLQYIQNITVTTDVSILSVDWMATYSYDIASYYKVLISKQAMIIQNCVYNGDGVVCKTAQSTSFDKTILYYEFFTSTVNLKDTIPVLAYVTAENQQVINFIQINNGKTFNPVEVSPGYNITDIDANARYVYVTVRDAHRIYVFKNDLDKYNIDFVITDTFMPYDHTTFYPRETILSPTDINVLVIRNINSIIIMRITAFTHEFISEIFIDELSDYLAQCKIIVARSTLLVIISISGQPDEIREYGGYDIYNPIQMRTIDLFGKSIVRPVEAFTINDGNLVAIKTKEFDNPIYLTLIRTGQSKVGSILVDVPISSNALSTLAGLEDSAIIEIAVRPDNLNKINYVYSTKRYFYKPLLIVRASLDSKFKDTFSFGLTVTTPNDNFSTRKSITVYNVKSKVEQSSVTPEQIKFPQNANTDEVEKEIPADKYFTGPIAKFEIECPYCGDQIKLKDHVTSLGSQSKVSNAVAFYYFEDKNRLWALTNNRIEVLDGSLAYITSIPFNVDTTNLEVLNWYVDKNGNVQVLFSKASDGSQFFIPVTPSDNKQGADFKQAVPITNTPGIKYAQVIKSLNNRVFVHDARLDDINSGVVHLFTRSNLNEVDTIVYEATIDYTTFGQANRVGINDFQLIDVPSSGNTGFFLSTLGNIGLAYFSFNTSDTQFATIKLNTYNLSTNDFVSSKLIDQSNFLQLEIINPNVNTNSIELGTILTVENGQHQQLVFKFKQDENGFTYETLTQTTVFGKYGKQNVLNWAQVIPNKNDANNVILIAHQGANYKISLGVYNLNYDNAGDTQEMRGAIERSASMNLASNFAALLFRDGNTLKVVNSVSNDGDTAPQLFSLSKTVSIVYKYDQPGDFDSIKLSGSNQQSKASVDIPVDFDRPSEGKGLAWYFILVIVIGGLLVIGLVVFLIVRFKRKNSSKESLLSTSKNDSDEE